MSSLIFNSALDDEARGNIDFDTDSFALMLVTSSYSADKKLHTKRSDISGEVATGGGYASGGVAATVSVTKDNSTNRINISLGGGNWPTSTITARGAVYYKSRGGLDSADELVAFIDFGSDVVSTAGSFTVTASTLRIQN